MAWIACPGTSSPSNSQNRQCRRPGPLARVYAADAQYPQEEDDGRTRLLASGHRIDPSSLRLKGSRLTWRDGGRLRSATLR